MKNKIIYCTLIVFALASNLFSAEPRLRPETWGQQIISDTMENWYKISDKVYRSAQPGDEGMKEIEMFGIKRILNLRTYHSDDDEAEGTGLKLFRVKMTPGSIHDDQVIRSLRIIREQEGPILVHCRHGSDRTGLVTAMYRIIFQNWSKEDAIDELINGGYGFHPFLYGNIPDYIRNVNIDSIRKDVMSGDKLPVR